MTLVFYRADGTETCFEFTLDQPCVEKGERPELHDLAENENVSAVLKGDSATLRARYSLQIGDDPDVVAKLKEMTPRDPKVEERPFTWRCPWEVNEAEKEKKNFALGQDTFGVSELKLFRHMSCEGEEIRQLLVSVPVSVQASPARENLMVQTVLDLLEMAPQTIRSNLEGQNESIVERDWSSGAASTAQPRIELDEIKKLVDRLQRPLLQLLRAPAYSVVREPCKVNIERVRHKTPILLRQYVNQWRRSEDGGAYGGHPSRSRMMVSDFRNVRSGVTRAHVVIYGFLRKLNGRLCRIRRISDEQWRATTTKYQRDKEAIRGKKAWLETDYAKKKEAFAEIGKEVDRYRSKLAWFCAHPLWQGCETQKLTVFTVSPEVFAGTCYYRQIYRAIREFEEKHFWWLPLEDREGLIAGLKRGKDATMRQRKYSILFEYWCFWRLIVGFEAQGFDFSHAQASLRRHLAQMLVIEPERLLMEPAESSEYKLTVVHGFDAYRNNTVAGSRFKLKTDDREYLTPDFALRIESKKTGRWFWMLMDAKSNSKLPKKAVEKRDDYLDLITYGDEDGTWYEPEQSWLFYAGDAGNPEQPDVPVGVAGIEGCDYDIVENYMWSETVNAKRCFHKNVDVSCSVEEGIVKKPHAADKPIKFVGHLRANAVSCPSPDLDSIREDASLCKEDPFSLFAQIQINTARRYLEDVPPSV